MDHNNNSIIHNATVCECVSVTCWSVSYHRHRSVNLKGGVLRGKWSPHWYGSWKIIIKKTAKACTTLWSGLCDACCQPYIFFSPFMYFIPSYVRDRRQRQRVISKHNQYFLHFFVIITVTPSSFHLFILFFWFNGIRASDSRNLESRIQNRRASHNHDELRRSVSPLRRTAPRVRSVLRAQRQTTEPHWRTDDFFVFVCVCLFVCGGKSIMSSY